MKSLKMMLVGILAVMLLTACGNSSNGASGNSEGNAEAEDSTNEETTNATTEVEEVDASEETEEAVEKEEITAQDVLQKSAEAMASLTSYTMETVSDNQITVDGEDTINMVTTTTSDMTLNPLAMYQVISVTSEEEMMEGMNNESYFTQDGFFIYDVMAGQWFKMPEEFAADLNSLSEMQTNPAEQLEMLQAYSDEITMTEEEDYYILNFEGSEEQFDELISMIGGMMGEDMGGMMQEMLSLMTLNKLNYLVHVDKETFYQSRVFVDMDMEMDVDGEKMTSVQKLDSTISDFNEVAEITVPQEVINNAQEITQEDLEQMEQQGSY